MLISLGWILVLIPTALIVYTYALYPALLWMIARRRPAAGHRSSLRPTVSIVVPAYNEEAQIRGAIEALLAQDYPSDRRQLLILSDASTDRTDQIVLEYEAQGVELFRLPVRRGKTAAENASAHLLRGEIVINTDASIRMHPAAVRHLVEAMADERVGVASSRDVSIARDAPGANTAEAGYVSYEMRVRALETRTGGIVGASGSGYAIRVGLHQKAVRDDLSRDFSAALTARTHGLTAVSVEEALCYVPRTTSLHAEYRRKVRTIARGVETLLHNAHLLNPARFGLFAWKLLSHKVCRWLVPPAVIVGIVGLTILAPAHRWAAVAFLAVLAIGATAGLGALWPTARPMPRTLSIVTFAVSANVAVIHALARVLHGHEDHLWEPTRRAAPTN